MGLTNNALYRRFSKEEYRQLRAIVSEENKSLLKRPQYIIGRILIIGSICCFVFKAFMPETFQWPKTGEMVGVAVGTIGGVFVLWLLIKLLKFKSVFAKAFIPIWAALMIFFGIISKQSSFEMKWEYIIYAGLVFFGWLCCCNSIKEHLCEKIFTSRKKKMEEVTR